MNYSYEIFNINNLTDNINNSNNTFIKSINTFINIIDYTIRICINNTLNIIINTFYKLQPIIINTINIIEKYKYFILFNIVLSSLIIIFHLIIFNYIEKRYKMKNDIEYNRKYNKVINKIINKMKKIN